MLQILLSISIWLHAFATVVFIGHFVLLTGIYIPALSKNGSALSEISKRSRPWMYISLMIFILTGIYLTSADPNYLGIGSFNNFWAVTMLVKHLLIFVMMALGFWCNAILRVGPRLNSNNSEQRISSKTTASPDILARSLPSVCNFPIRKTRKSRC